MLKKSLALLLVSSQLMMTGAWAESTSSSGMSNAATQALSSPEAMLLTKTIAAEGAGLSQTELKESVSSAISQYNSTAPVNGRLERLQAAMVSMNIATSQQAASYVAAVTATEQAVAGDTQNATPDQAKKIVSEETNRLMTASSSGAQFSSSCEAGKAMFLAGVAIFIGDGIAVMSAGEGNWFNPKGVTASQNPATIIALSGFFIGVIGGAIATSC